MLWQGSRKIGASTKPPKYVIRSKRFILLKYV